MAGNPDDKLTSWKQIAVFLKVDARTAQRWEREFALPVHRPAGSKGYSVFAYRDELDSWLRNRGSQESANREGAPARTNGGQGMEMAIGTGARRAVAEPALDVVAVSAAAEPEQGIERTISGTRRWNRLVWLVMLLALTCGLVLLVYTVYFGGPVARVSFSGSSLEAWNDRGNRLWAYDFGQPLNVAPDGSGPERVRIVDLGPGREQDVLAVAPLFSDRANSSSDALYCISARGKLRWSQPFDDHPRFGGRDYGPPWVAAKLMVTQSGNASSIWCAARENYSSVSVLMKLNRDGRKLAEFVNWGHIAILEEMSHPSGSYILAGGISNQCNCAVLAVLPEAHPSGSSPAHAPAFQCDNCPAGQPYRYLLFPQPELTGLSGSTYNLLSVIRTDEGRVWVGVAETRGQGLDNWKRYDLSDSFVPQSVWVSDQYWALHRQMESEGKIHHTVEQCPERTQPQPVQMWSPEDGWKDIKVPVVPVAR